MKKIAAAVLLLPICPFVAYASGIDIPELGVHIAQLPDGAKPPQLIRRHDGYLAIVRIGQATLTIARVDEPLLAESDLGNADIRAAQRAEFYEPPDLKTQEHAVTIAGHEAWTTLTATGRGWGTVYYRCITYTVVDQHLYRFLADATSEDKTRPPDFDAAVRVMSQLTFTPVDRSSAQRAKTATGLLKMPAAEIPGRDAVSLSAVALGLPGVVDLEYSIDGKGRVQDLRETYSESPRLALAAEELLKSATFPVNSRWETDGHRTLRFTTEVQFWPNQCLRNVAPQTLGADVMTICRHR
jgi:hypothetical protein